MKETPSGNVVESFHFCPHRVEEFTLTGPWISSPEMHCPHVSLLLLRYIREGCLSNKKGEYGNGWIAALSPPQEKFF
jgi:hypothetical protein